MTEQSVVAIDLGGSSMKGALVAADGTALARVDAPTPAAAGGQRYLPRRSISPAASRPPPTRGRVVAAAAITPGQVHEGVVRFAANVGFRDVPLAAELSTALGVPAAVEHDAAGAALAEAAHGSRGDDCLFVALGTGIGSGHVRGGAVATGSTGGAGELGHIPVYPDGEPCACGQLGCLEVYASGGRGGTPVRRRRRAAATSADARTAHDASADAVVARLGHDPVARAVWAKAIEALALALATTTLLVDPGCHRARRRPGRAPGDALRKPLSGRLAARLAWRSRRRSSCPALGMDAGWRGASLLAVVGGPLSASPGGCRSMTGAATSPIGSVQPGRVRTGSTAAPREARCCRDRPLWSVGRDAGGRPGRRLGHRVRRGDHRRRNRATAARRAAGRPRRGMAAARVHRPTRPRRRRVRLRRRPDELASAVAFHRAHGTTRTLVSLVTAPVARMCEQLRWIAALAEAGPQPGGHVVGAHLEGPFLSHARCGAQHPEHLLEPDPQTLAELLKAGQGWVRAVTLAPELPGGLDLVDRLVDEGVVAAVGHTDARYAEALAGFARGATLLTHAYNGMRPLHHREPGPVAAALDAGATCEVINDQIHVHPAAVRLIAHGRSRLSPTPSMRPGRGDGRYTLGRAGRRWSPRGRPASPATGRSPAARLTMDAAVRAAVQEVGLPIEAASAAGVGGARAGARPADRCGAIATGLDADLVVLVDDLRVRRVMAQGGLGAGVVTTVPVTRSGAASAAGERRECHTAQATMSGRSRADGGSSRCLHDAASGRAARSRRGCPAPPGARSR
jgi:N-acetylglucosamine-6-phosphate deacetylase